MAGALFANVAVGADRAFAQEAEDIQIESPRAQEIDEDLQWTTILPTEVETPFDPNGNKIIRSISTHTKINRKKNSSDSKSTCCNNLTAYVSDQWRRATQSQCDPFVVIEFKGKYNLFIYV